MFKTTTCRICCEKAQTTADKLVDKTYLYVDFVDFKLHVFGINVSQDKENDDIFADEICQFCYKVIHLAKTNRTSQLSHTISAEKKSRTWEIIYG